MSGIVDRVGSGDIPECWPIRLFSRAFESGVRDGLVDGFDRAPRRVFADGQHGEGDVLPRIVAKHAADSDVHPFLPVAPQDVIRMGLELEAEAHQVTPRTTCAMPRL